MYKEISDLERGCPQDVQACKANSELHVEMVKHELT